MGIFRWIGRMIWGAWRAIARLFRRSVFLVTALISATSLVSLVSDAFQLDLFGWIGAMRDQYSGWRDAVFSPVETVILTRTQFSTPDWLKDLIAVNAAVAVAVESGTKASVKLEDDKDRRKAYKKAAKSDGLSGDLLRIVFAVPTLFKRASHLPQAMRDHRAAAPEDKPETLRVLRENGYSVAFIVITAITTVIVLIIGSVAPARDAAPEELAPEEAPVEAAPSP